jgi:hypothetical protein
MTLKFLALQGAPYIYDISRLRVIPPPPPADSPESIRCLFSDHLRALAATLVTVFVPI